MTKKTVNPVQRGKRMNVDYNDEDDDDNTNNNNNNVVEEQDEDVDEEPKEKKGKKKVPSQAQPAAKSSLNWPAIAILCMFALPLLLGGILQAMDFFYPEAAKERKIRERVLRCYEAANPSKISEVDKFIERYKGREHVLFSQLKNKYERIPECQ
jgi:hypothetical protein